VLFLLLACAESPSTQPQVDQPSSISQTPPNNPPNNPKNGPPMMPGLSPSEDLSSSWSTQLVKAVPTATVVKDCPDKDNDGYLDARICGNTQGIKSDCNDNDASIGPAQEIYIQASPFIMGSISSHAGADEKPVHVVQLDGYCLDTNEISSNEFANWLRQSNRSPQGPDIKHISTDSIVESGRENHPVEGVTWEEANSYCLSLNKNLPSEAQWEKAARGGCELGEDPTQCDPKDLRAYPWGNDTPSCDKANHQLSASGMPKLCVSDTLLAEALPQGKGPYGHNHLAGNVWEYVQDVWHPNVYGINRVNPTGPTEGDIHVLRGGGWNTFSTNMRAANRFHDLVMGSAAGFRCARSFSNGNADNVEPLVLEEVSGTITAAKALTGRAIYVTAFDANDADASGMLAPGRSPIAEIRLTPNEKTQQPFQIQLPRGGSYILSAALDAGSGGNKDNYISASGSGGFGQAEGNPIRVEKSVSNITIQLQAAPSAPSPMKGPHKPPGHPPGKPPSPPRK